MKSDTVMADGTEEAHLTADGRPMPGSYYDGSEIACVAPTRSGTAMSRLEIKLKETEQELEYERQSRQDDKHSQNTALVNLQSKLNHVEKSLEAEQDKHQQTKFNLVEKEKEASHHLQLKLDAVGELNRFLRGNQVSNQSTDREIVEKAMMLRVNIRDFAIHYFQDSIKEARIQPEESESLNKYLRIPQHYLNNAIYDPRMRVRLVRAFMWAYLCDHIFGCFRWALKDAGAVFHKMCGLLEDLRDEKENADPEGIRKYQTWKANTTNLLIETMRLDKETADMDRQEFIEQKVKRISKILRPLRSSSLQDYQNGLESVIAQSLELDGGDQ